MIFLRIGNGQSLISLPQPHTIYHTSRQGPWLIRRWGSKTEHIVVGGTPTEAMPRSEYEVSGLMLPFGSIGFIVSWHPETNRADEFVVFSTIEGSSFRYRELAISMNREAITVEGFDQVWRLDVRYDPVDQARIAHVEVPLELSLRIPSLDHLREELRRRWCGDGRSERESGGRW